VTLSLHTFFRPPFPGLFKKVFGAEISINSVQSNIFVPVEESFDSKSGTFAKKANS